jgi:pyroglutamyl-peptidase
VTFALRAAGIPAKLSNSPSTYLCNQMMYTVLHLVDRKHMSTKAGFIHVPATPSYVAKQAYPFVEMPSMSIELMTLAVLKSLAAITAAPRDIQAPTFNY